MNNTMEVIFGLLGGLAVFIFGMNMMSDCLQKAAGEKMKSILSLLTGNPIMGVIAGALTTAVLQSSSATTVMAIGFVSAGLMTLPQAISIILGANIGTTMTAQIIAFKLSDYIYIIIFIGFIVSFLVKSERAKNIGQTIFAFGLLFLGIETMGSVMKPLASSPVFTDMIANVADIPVLGVIVGTFMTLVVQSSSATIAVLQNFASQPGADGVTSMLGLTGAIPILLGDNIGTTITAVLASVGQTKDAKRTAAAHCIFNISGCLLFIWFVKPYAAFIQLVSPKGNEIEVISRQIANAHTFFNIAMTVIWVPLIWLMVKIVMKLVPDGKKVVCSNAEAMYLDTRLLGQPTAALQLLTKEIVRFTELVRNNLKELIASFDENKSYKIENVISNAEDIGQLYGKITEYLSELFSTGGLTEEQVSHTAEIMYVLSDIERMGILCKEIGNSLKDKEKKKYDFSDKAMDDLKDGLQIIDKMYSQVIDSLIIGGVEDEKKLMKQKGQMVNWGIKMSKSHAQRVNKGKCVAKLTQPFNKILHTMDRMGNCCINMFDAVQGQIGLNHYLKYGDKG